MRPIVGVPWWMAMLLGVAALPVVIVYQVAKIVYEIVDEGLHGPRR